MRISQLIASIVSPIIGIGSALSSRQSAGYADNGDVDRETVPDPASQFGPYVYSGNSALRVCTYPVPGGYMCAVWDDNSNCVIASEGPIMFREVAYDIGTNLLMDSIEDGEDVPEAPLYDPHKDPDIIAWEKFYGASYGRPSYPPTEDQLSLCFQRNDAR